MDWIGQVGLEMMFKQICDYC